MHSSVKRLLSLATTTMAPPVSNPAGLSEFLASWGALGEELAEALIAKNGFWAFESSLVVRPFSSKESPLGIVEWNDPTIWKYAYIDELDDALFFGEDAFGCQFCFANDEVKVFEPETAKFEDIANSFGEWASILLSDINYRTGFPAAHDWVNKHGPLIPGFRLIPKLPFVVGGKYDTDNLYACNEVQGMLFRASLANQIRDVRDGGQIIIDIIGDTNKGSASE
jgi:hypothetical protein